MCVGEREDLGWSRRLVLLAARPDAFLLGGLADTTFATAVAKAFSEMPTTPRRDPAEKLSANLSQYLARAANDRFVIAFGFRHRQGSLRQQQLGGDHRRFRPWPEPIRVRAERVI